MSAIIFSMESGSEYNAEKAIEFLKSHRTMAWGSHIRIDPKKFMASVSNPLVSYINYESEVRYKVNIIKIIRNRIPKPYPNPDERPDEWANAKWKTFFRFNKIDEIGPVDTTSFKRPNGQKVKHPPENYVEVVD